MGSELNRQTTCLDCDGYHLVRRLAWAVGRDEHGRRASRSVRAETRHVDRSVHRSRCGPRLSHDEPTNRILGWDRCLRDLLRLHGLKAVDTDAVQRVRVVSRYGGLLGWRGLIGGNEAIAAADRGSARRLKQRSSLNPRTAAVRFYGARWSRTYHHVKPVRVGPGSLRLVLAHAARRPGKVLEGTHRRTKGREDGLSVWRNWRLPLRHRQMVAPPNFAKQRDPGA